MLAKLEREQWIKMGQKMSSRIETARARRNGELVNPNVCSKCGATENIEAHHEDYSKPLDVTWLCHNCHVAKTNENKRKTKVKTDIELIKEEIAMLEALLEFKEKW